MMNKATTDLCHERGMTDSQAMACANRLVWRVSVLLLGGMGILLLLLGDRSLSLALIGGTASVWFLVTGIIHYFFRDPEPDVPQAPNVFVAPAHGLVDVVDATSNLDFMGGPCRRISIFLSVFDVHVQYAPAAGTIVFLQRQSGHFLSAMRTQSAQCNENVLIGIECLAGPGVRVAVRQIAGLIARRIVSWIDLRHSVDCGQRLGLIQFGSRCDLYLPLSVQVRVRPGDRVVGGETIIGDTSRRESDDFLVQASRPGVPKENAGVLGGDIVAPS